MREMSGIFANCSVVLELKGLPFKEKNKLKTAVTDNGGVISYVINKQCTHVVTNDLDRVSTNRQRSIQKFQVPVVKVEYLSRCLENGCLLPTEEFVHPHVSQLALKVIGQSSPGGKCGVQMPFQVPAPQTKKLAKTGNYLGRFRVYNQNDEDVPKFPSDFEVAKYTLFERRQVGRSWWSVLELQSWRAEAEQAYRVVQQCGDGGGVEVNLVHCPTSEEALEAYQELKEDLQVRNFQPRTALSLKAPNLGSDQLQQLLLDEKLNTSAISQEVGVFVELLWTEAMGCLDSVLRVPITSISLNDVSRAEGLLLQVQKELKEGKRPKQLEELLADIYTLLPHKQIFPPSIKIISQKLDLCQLIRDVLKVSEVTLWSPAPSSLGKYHALNCSVESLPPDSPECQTVTTLLHDRPVRVLQVFRIGRPVELQTFRRALGNVRPLLHSSAPSSFVGILSRGLLLPRVGVEHHGIERTDVGNLGSGIYFSDSVCTSLKYSKPGETDGTRLLLVCDVALGRCKDLRKKDVGLTGAPEGYHSVHGVRCSPKTPSDFEDDEYVVYSTNQVQMKYVVQYTLEDDPVIDFQPFVDVSAAIHQPTAACDLHEDEEEGCKNPLEMTAGLLDSAGQPLPLQAVHVKCKLMDLMSEVIIFQTYVNQSPVPIEAKFVFPLDESAAVCGFEAFINGKHVVGKVKEKEQARKEYRQAIEEGHGAYLMDQDAPDVFTISVGNLPPDATVLIKVTYISELIVRDGAILFTLPGSVAPWQQSKALNENTQGCLDKVCVSDLPAEGKFDLEMAIEMPYKILDLRCVTHRVKIKKTDCKAVVSTREGQAFGSEGFQLTFTLSEVHLPRMWVENHPDKESQACMLVFYPNFHSSGSGPSSEAREVVILLDSSESMRGVAMQDARRIAVRVLKALGGKVRVNVITFGTEHNELFISSQPCETAHESAKKFLMSSPPLGGSTNLWRPLHSLSLLPPSIGIRNFLLISDGHIQNESLTLQLIRDNVSHSRVFTCGVSPTANRHMLRALAQAGGGAYEFFDAKTKYTWPDKVASQVRRMSSFGCSSVSVKWQQFDPAAPRPVQAPAQLHALFSDCHTLVCGFVPHCTQATLLGQLNDQKIETMVSTSELQKTKGTFLHKLTARAVIRDYEDGNLDGDEAEHEGKKAELKSYVIELSKEHSIITQFTSFVAVEERDLAHPGVGFTDIPRLIAAEDVDFLPYIGWEEEGLETDESIGALYVDFAEEDSDHVVDGSDQFGICELDFSFACYATVESDHSVDGPDLLGTCEPDFSPFCQSRLFGDEMDEVCFLSVDRLPEPAFSHSVLAEYRGPEGAVSRSVSADRHPEPEGAISRFVSADRHPEPKAELYLSMSADRHPKPAFSHSVLAEYHGPEGAISHSLSADRHPEPQAGSCFVPVDCRSKSPFKILPTPFNLYRPPPPPPTCADQGVLGGLSAGSGVNTHVFPGAPVPPRADQGILVGLSLPPTRSFSRKRKSAPRFIGSHRMDTAGPQDGPGSCTESTSLTSDSTEPIMDSFEVQRSNYPISQVTWGSQPIRLAQKELLTSLPTSLGAFPCQSAGDLAAGIPQPVRLKELCRKMSRRTKLRIESDKPRWEELFGLQHQDGYWECTAVLGSLLKLDMDYFANVFLKEKGIVSFGAKAHSDILKLVATLLVLQLIRVKQLPEGKLLKTLFRLEEPETKTSRWEAVKKAVEWVTWADRQYPCVHSRLEFGREWESATRQLLSVDPLHSHSPLRSVLERIQEVPRSPNVPFRPILAC